MTGKKPISSKEAYLRATTLCARGEQCSHDIREKLIKWGLSPSESDKIIAQLLEERFIDDNRYAMAFSRDKAKFQRWGKLKITYHLRMKKISKEIIENSLEGIEDNDYEEKLLSLLKSKRKSIKIDDNYKIKASLYRYGLSRGFESALILKTIPKVLDNTEYADEDEW